MQNSGLYSILKDHKTLEHITRSLCLLLQTFLRSNPSPSSIPSHGKLVSLNTSDYHVTLSHSISWHQNLHWKMKCWWYCMAWGTYGNTVTSNMISMNISWRLNENEMQRKKHHIWVSWSPVEDIIFTFNGSQLAKNEKSTFPTCPCHEIYREEAVGLKTSNYT